MASLLLRSVQRSTFMGAERSSLPRTCFGVAITSSEHHMAS